jgi:hypothetical protein
VRAAASAWPRRSSQRLASFDARGGQCGVGVRHCTAVQCNMWWPTTIPARHRGMPRRVGCAARSALQDGAAAAAAPAARDGPHHQDFPHRSKRGCRHGGMARDTRHGTCHTTRGMARPAHQSRRLSTGRECLASHRIASHRGYTYARAMCNPHECDVAAMPRSSVRHEPACHGMAWHGSQAEDGQRDRWRSDVASLRCSCARWMGAHDTAAKGRTRSCRASV